MNLDALLHHYLGADDPAALDPTVLADSAQRIAIDFGVERDAGRRFALWALLHVLGHAPDPDSAFKTAGEREAAREFAWMLAGAEDKAVRDAEDAGHAAG